MKSIRNIGTIGSYNKFANNTLLYVGKKRSNMMIVIGSLEKIRTIKDLRKIKQLVGFLLTLTIAPKVVISQLILKNARKINSGHLMVVV